MFYKKINILILLFCLSACKVNYDYPQVEQPLVQSSYGIWGLNNCKLTASRAGVKVKLTDVYADDSARLTFKFNHYPKYSPVVNIIGLEGYDLHITGARDFYSMEIPASIFDQAKMYLDQAFLQIRYRDVYKDYDTRAIFPLEGLPEAMLYISKNCQ